MALTILKQQLRQIHAGQNGYTEVSGLAQFTLTDANGELDALFQNIENIEVNNPIGAPADDETIYVDEVAQIASGVIQRPAAKTLTIARTGAAKTNNLIFAFRYRGY